MGEHDHRIALLREAGYEDAARLLEALPESQPTAGPPGGEAKPPGITLLDATPEDAQRRREGEYLLGEMREAGIGDGWVTVGDLMGGEK